MLNSPYSDHPSKQSLLQNISILAFPLFSLIAPFLVFLDYQSYDLFRLEIGIAIFGFILVSLVCSIGLRYGGFIGEKFLAFVLAAFFASIQFSSSGEIVFGLILIGVAVFLFLFKEHFLLIAAAIFAMLFLVTFVQVIVPKKNLSLGLDSQSLIARGTPLPRVIHIVMDEHIGLEGLPRDMPEGAIVKNHLLEFYRKYGFMTFGGAYSRYFHTVNSIANLLNFSAIPKDRMYVEKNGGPNVLLRNIYFEKLSEVGFGLNVWWGHHIDYCSMSKVAIENCFQIPANGLALSQTLPLSTLDRLQLVLSGYFNLSKMYQIVRDSYQDIRNHLLAYDIPLPSATWDRHKVTALPYLNSLDILWDKIITLPEGHVFFAHLLLPHYPYVANSNCTIKSTIQKWKYSSLLFSPHHPYREGAHNTESSRKNHYQEYLKQVQCVNDKLGELFSRMQTAGIFENSVIIIHGDHGSRIVKREPTIESQQELDNQDIVDGFSTLFAVKLPNQDGYYNSNPYPLEFLLEEKVVNFILGKKSTQMPPEPVVYLKSVDPAYQELQSFPYPHLGLHKGSE